MVRAVVAAVGNKDTMGDHRPVQSAAAIRVMILNHQTTESDGGDR